MTWGGAGKSVKRRDLAHHDGASRNALAQQELRRAPRHPAQDVGIVADDLVWIVTAKRKYLATQTLKDLELRLKNTSFRRIHRGALVNVDHVRKMSALSSQRWLITMHNDQEFIASKRLAHGVRELLSW